MAIGFSLSAVLGDLESDDEEDAIYFQLRNVRYKIVIDDMDRAIDVINAINTIIEKRKRVKPAKQRDLPEFYKK